MSLALFWSAAGLAGIGGAVTLLGTLLTRDEQQQQPRAALFVLDRTAGIPSLPLWLQNGTLQVQASLDAENATAVFRHGDWVGGDVVGTMGGFSMEALSTNTNGLLSGNFSLPQANASEPLTGQWIMVDETAEPSKQAAFHYLADVLASKKEQQDMTLEEMLAVIVKTGAVADATKQD